MQESLEDPRERRGAVGGGEEERKEGRKEGKREGRKEKEKRQGTPSVFVPPAVDLLDSFK